MLRIMISVLIFIIIFLFILILFLRGRLISSSVMWIFCYFLIFLITPFFLKVSNKNLIELNALVGILFFTIGFFLSEAYVKHSGTEHFDRLRGSIETDFSIYGRFWIIIFFVVVVLLFFDIGKYGFYSLISGKETLRSTLSSDDLSVGNMFGLFLRMMGSISVMLVLVARKKTEMILALISCFIYVIFNAFFSFARSGIIYLILILSMYFVRNSSRFSQVLLLFFSGLLVVFFMVFGGYFRSFGAGEVSGFIEYLKDVKNIPEFLLGSLDFSAAYKWYSRLLYNDSIWINPIVYLKPILMFIPRAIFPWKPEALTVQILKQLDPILAASGFSTGMSILGEAYAVMGKIGYVIYPLIWGIVCSYKDRTYFYRLKTRQYAPEKMAFYYYFATMIIIESHRGDFSAVFCRYLWTTLIPILLISKYGHKIFPPNRKRI